MSDDQFPMDGEGPFFTEYLKDIQDSSSPVWDEDAGTVVYVSNSSFGLASLIWPASGGVFNNKADIISRFNEVYAYREIGAETRERWMHNLQVKFNGLITKWNHRFAQYAANTAHLTDLSEEIVTSTSGADRFFDTPGNQVTLSTGYLTNEADSSGTATVKDPKGTVLEAVNRNIEEFRDLLDEFVDEFDECFIQLYRP